MSLYTEYLWGLDIESIDQNETTDRFIDKIIVSCNPTLYIQTHTINKPKIIVILVLCLYVCEGRERG